MTRLEPDGLFNSPLEAGLRIVTILDAASPDALDVQRLGILDYLLVHSKDADGPPSLHPATPMRGGEITVRRTLLEKGLLWMASAGLLEQQLTPEGFLYAASDAARPFLDSLTSHYAANLRSRAKWLADNFLSYSSEGLEDYVSSRVARWTSDFAIVARYEAPAN